MDAFGVLGDPVRRRIVEVLASGERSAGEVVHVVGGEFGIGQSAVSQQLKVLREHGFARVRPEGARRVYALDAIGVRAVDAWLRAVGVFWNDRLDDLASELEGGPAAAVTARAVEVGSAAATRVGHANASTLDAIVRPVHDVAKAVAFYGTDGIGLPVVPDATSANAERATFDAGGVRLVVVRQSAIVDDATTLTFSVPDLRRAVDRLRALGVSPDGVTGRSGEARRDERPARASFGDAEGRPIVLVERLER